jgi:hypothetical protein
MSSKNKMFPRNPQPVTRPNSRSRASSLFAMVALFLLAAIFPNAAKAATEIPPSPTAQTAVTTTGPNLQFTLADFDGDHRPDQVNVQTGEANATGTSYWIDLQLSSTGEQSFPVNAASGGLQLSAQDVNGDESIDLVLTTTWLRKPVAIFLNNGHGIFTRIAAEAFPSAFRNQDFSVTAPADPDAKSLAESLPTRPDLAVIKARQQNPATQAARAPSARAINDATSTQLSASSRAPPFANFLQ